MSTCFQLKERATYIVHLHSWFPSGRAGHRFGDLVPQLVGVLGYVLCRQIASKWKSRLS
jgi:hypothetical protein